MGYKISYKVVSEQGEQLKNIAKDMDNYSSQLNQIISRLGDDELLQSVRGDLNKFLKQLEEEKTVLNMAGQIISDVIQSYTGAEKKSVQKVDKAKAHNRDFYKRPVAVASAGGGATAAAVGGASATAVNVDATTVNIDASTTNVYAAGSVGGAVAGTAASGAGAVTSGVAEAAGAMTSGVAEAAGGAVSKVAEHASGLSDAMGAGIAAAAATAVVGGGIAGAAVMKKNSEANNNAVGSEA